MYHDIVSDGRWNSSGFPGAGADVYKLSSNRFGRHLEMLSEHNSRAVLAGSDDEWGAANPVYITFDDGGQSGYTVAADMLEKYGWRGHFFVATNFIGNAGFLTATQIRELHERGHVVASHSHTHPTRMSYCRRDQLLTEWEISVAKLQDIIGCPVTAASVPGGFFSKAVGETAAECGIRILFNSEPVLSQYHIDGCRIIGRFTVQQNISEREFDALIRGIYSYRLREYLRWNSKKAAKRLGGSLYLDVQKRIFAMRQQGQNENS